MGLKQEWKIYSNVRCVLFCFAYLIGGPAAGSYAHVVCLFVCWLVG